MWVEGVDITKVGDLMATRLWRGGADLNVAGMLKFAPVPLGYGRPAPTITLMGLQRSAVQAATSLSLARDAAGVLRCGR